MKPSLQSSVFSPQSAALDPHPSTLGLCLTEIRFLEVDDWFVTETGDIGRKVGRQMPLVDNTRLGIKHLVEIEVPRRRGLVALPAQTRVWADPDRQHRNEFPVAFLLEAA